MLQEKSVTRTSRSGSDQPTSSKPRLQAEFVSSEAEIKAAQKLRYDLFCEEYNVTLPVNATWNGHPIDMDEIDAGCLHLVVKDTNSMESIGYTRVLTQDLANKLGGFYSAHEFDISNIENIDGRIMEIGRTCIHPDYRNGATIAVLWSRLAQFMMENNYQYLFGCASISLADGGSAFDAIMPALREKHMAKGDFQVVPKLPIEKKAPSADNSVRYPLPPLLKAYMKMGAQICGEPCWDPEFNVADVFVILDLQQVAGRYAKRFLKAS